MKLSYFKVLVVTIAVSSFACVGPTEHQQSVSGGQTIHDFKVAGIDGSTIDLNDFKGKKILIVNVASRCGFTRQYEGLEALYREHNDKLVVIGFPSNSFRQELETNEEIIEFCQREFGVTFLLTEPVSVRGEDQHEVFKWLTDESLNGWNTTEPQWNFFKYLINEEGELTHMFPSQTEPMSEEIVSLL